jgi:hypothetical protein
MVGHHVGLIQGSQDVSLVGSSLKICLPDVS